MSSTSFTFLNATGTPWLCQSDAKLMRAHITKTNFANRRQRLIKTRTAKERSKRIALMRMGPGLLAQDVSVDAPPLDLLLATPPKDPYRYAQFLSRFWSLVFLDGGDYPNSPEEQAWIQLLVSEAALAESSMAVGIRHWSPDAPCQEKAMAHSCKAANIIIQHIKSETAHAGAVLGAVLSMAIGERLRHNNHVWNIHVDGLASLITERRSQGECDLPPVLSNFLILDSTNYIFSFPLAYHRKIIDAIRAYGSQPICIIANISYSLVQLRKSIDTHRKYSSGSEVREIEIQKIWNSLLCQARSLRFDDNPFIQATSRAIELILYLSWFPQPEANLTLLASELKEALCRLPFRPCLFMDLTSSQLMLGAIAAGKGSEVRAWFVARLGRAVLALRSRGWVRPLEILERGFVSNEGLVARFRTLWRELDR